MDSPLTSFPYHKNLKQMWMLVCVMCEFMCVRLFVEGELGTIHVEQNLVYIPWTFPCVVKATLVSLITMLLVICSNGINREQAGLQ